MSLEGGIAHRFHESTWREIELTILHSITYDKDCTSSEIRIFERSEIDREFNLHFPVLIYEIESAPYKLSAAGRL